MNTADTSQPNQLQDHNLADVPVYKHIKSAFFNQEELPWAPWVMPDTYFKLLAINTHSGGFTMMLKVGPNNIAPIHGHVGAVEGYILEGGFAYEDDWGFKDHYVFEPAGINHKPVTGDEGMMMFAIAHGPLMGYNEDGSVALVLDARKMYDMAVEHNAAGHIDLPDEWDQ
ncbi:2,4'-dihydroxyacetophenone dioxygenase family protein [Parahaliea mediterranea]|uniref:2,4'-dihydroxyacetophenone dioxygenase family protein n=1 Tax=Parahaliea mediterranea TaxID=651086 RepID=A0A939DEB5_9GAMM|nr:2,4'-dihydroxyacetophenone dioxygenase family protein [Parahaliea mediterranea]MBN7796626.1 2,4'-dihydroxyacetophenone dioxygenase family protein [Parahaliea mediterranea]